MLKLKPFQEVAREEMIRRPRLAVFYDLGTGKTPIAIKALESFSLQDFPATIVVPAYLVGHWVREFKKWLASSDVEVYNLSKILKKGYYTPRLLMPKDHRVIFVISYAMLRSRSRPLVALRKAIKTVVLDESIKIANPKSKIAKLLSGIGGTRFFANSSRRYILCGRPITESELQIFSQAKFLGDMYFGPNYYEFRKRYFSPDFMGYKWTFKNYMKDIFAAKLNSFSIRCRREDVMPELPGMMRSEIVFELSSVERGIINELVDNAGLRFGDELYATDVTVALAQKVQQLSSGFFSFKSTIEHEVFLSDTIRQSKFKAKYKLIGELYRSISMPTRVKHLLELIEGLSEKRTIIFCAHKAEAKEVYTYLYTKYKGVALITGDVDQDRKEAIREKFQAKELPIIVATTDSIARGFNMSKAEAMVFCSHVHSFDTRDQALARPQREGQETRLLVYDLIAEGTVDEDIMKAYEVKKNLDSYFSSIKKKKEELCVQN